MDITKLNWYNTYIRGSGAYSGLKRNARKIIFHLLDTLLFYGGR